MRYQADIDKGTLVFWGGRLVAASGEDLRRVGFLTAQHTVPAVRGGIDHDLPPSLLTTAEYGLVTIDAFAHRTEPPLPDEDWTDVVDVTFDAAIDPDDADTEAGLVAVGLFEGPDFVSPPLTPEPGLYRVRISARNRDIPWMDEVVEAYRFDAWPVDEAAALVIHRRTRS